MGARRCRRSCGSARGSIASSRRVRHPAADPRGPRVPQGLSRHARRPAARRRDLRRRGAGVSRGTRHVSRPESLLRGENEGYQPIASLFFIWGAVWWVGAGFHEVVDVPRFPVPGERLHRIRLGDRAPLLAHGRTRALGGGAQWPTYLYAPALFFLAIASFFDQTHPLDDMGWVAWPLRVHRPLRDTPPPAGRVARAMDALDARDRRDRACDARRAGARVGGRPVHGERDGMEPRRAHRGAGCADPVRSRAVAR